MIRIISCHMLSMSSFISTTAQHIFKAWLDWSSNVFSRKCAQHVHKVETVTHALKWGVFKLPWTSLPDLLNIWSTCWTAEVNLKTSKTLIVIMYVLSEDDLVESEPSATSSICIFVRYSLQMLTAHFFSAQHVLLLNSIVAFLSHCYSRYSMMWSMLCAAVFSQMLSTC